MITDDHAHLDHEWLLNKYNDIESYLKIQKENGVKYIIANSVDRKVSQESLALSASHEIVLPAIGIYPIDELARETKKDDSQPFIPDYGIVDEDMSWIKGNASRAVAIGEVGLDFSNPEADKRLQLYVFSRMIDVAISKSIPLIIHTRKAEAEVLELLERKKAKKVVLHCFTGKKNLIEVAKQNGYYFSIPTNVVRSQQFQMIVDKVDMSRILTETDAPFLSPFKDEEPNESRFISESLKTIAKIKGMEQDEVAKVIFQNFQRLYL
ncbi:MAG: TatD family hydrolase [Candidatus Woesearchaeota archaeon]